MTDLEINIASFNDLLLNQETLKAIELFYADKVIVQENEEPPRVGKEHCLEFEKQNLNKIKLSKFTLLNQAINNAQKIVFSEWEINFVDLDDKSFSLTEVSVQQWDGRQIIREKFYYQKLLGNS